MLMFSSSKSSICWLENSLSEIRWQEDQNKMDDAMKQEY